MVGKGGYHPKAFGGGSARGGGKAGREKQQEDELRLLPAPLTPHKSGPAQQLLVTHAQERSTARGARQPDPLAGKAEDANRPVVPRSRGAGLFLRPATRSANLDCSLHSRSRNEEQRCFLVLRTDKVTKRDRAKESPS